MDPTSGMILCCETTTFQFVGTFGCWSATVLLTSAVIATVAESEDPTSFSVDKYRTAFHTSPSRKPAKLLILPEVLPNKMESIAVLSQNNTELSSMDKADASCRLFGQIQWEEIVRSGVFLNHHDVSFICSAFVSIMTRSLKTHLGLHAEEYWKIHYAICFLLPILIDGDSTVPTSIFKCNIIFLLFFIYVAQRSTRSASAP